MRISDWSSDVCSSDLHKEAISGFLSPLQLGVGVAGGAEAIRHYIGAAREQHPDWVFLAVDFTNAFNTLQRAHVLREVAQHFPHSSLLVQKLYVQSHPFGCPLPRWQSASASCLRKV